MQTFCDNWTLITSCIALISDHISAHNHFAENFEYVRSLALPMLDQYILIYLCETVSLLLIKHMLPIDKMMTQYNLIK